MGQGFGLGFAVSTEPDNIPDQSGHFIGQVHPARTFFVDQQRLIIIMMIQVRTPANSFYRRAVRYLAHQALSDSD